MSELMPIDTANTLSNLNAMQPRFDRGYTGHSLSRFFIGKHMAGFGLINMNGRLGVYPAASGNPYLQRFLSPDNFVQDPGNTQNYNRYCYCSNNPLMYTVPTGWLQAAAWEYRNLGKEKTNQVDFGIGNYYGEACTGGGTSELIFEMENSWAATHTYGPWAMDNLMGSLWNATPENGAKIFTNVDGNWYNTGTTIISGLNNKANSFHCAPPLTGDVFFKKNVQGLTKEQIQQPNQCLAAMFSYISEQLCGTNLEPLSLIVPYSILTGIGMGDAKEKGLLFTMPNSGVLFNEFFDSYFTRSGESSVIDAINNGHPVFASRDGLNHAVVIVGYNYDGDRPIYIYVDPTAIGFNRDSGRFDSVLIPISGCK